FRKGDEITVFPSGRRSRIRSIHAAENEIAEAYAPLSVTITLDDDVDVSRGNMLVRSNNLPEVVTEFDAMLCWLHHKPATPPARFSIMHTSNGQKAILKEVVYKVDINTFDRVEHDPNLNMNDIARVTLKTTQPLMVDAYRANRNTGSIILIDEATNETVAAGMII